MPSPEVKQDPIVKMGGYVSFVVGLACVVGIVFFSSYQQRKVDEQETRIAAIEESLRHQNFKSKAVEVVLKMRTKDGPNVDPQKDGAVNFYFSPQQPDEYFYHGHEKGGFGIKVVAIWYVPFYNAEGLKFFERFQFKQTSANGISVELRPGEKAKDDIRLWVYVLFLDAAESS